MLRSVRTLLAVLVALPALVVPIVRPAAGPALAAPALQPAAGQFVPVGSVTLASGVDVPAGGTVEVAAGGHGPVPPGAVAVTVNLSVSGRPVAHSRCTRGARRHRPRPPSPTGPAWSPGWPARSG